MSRASRALLARASLLLLPSPSPSVPPPFRAAFESPIPRAYGTSPHQRGTTTCSENALSNTPHDLNRPDLVTPPQKTLSGKGSLNGEGHSGVQQTAGFHDLEAQVVEPVSGPLGSFCRMNGG